MKKLTLVLFLCLISCVAAAQVTSSFSCNGTTALTAVNQYCKNSSGTNQLPSGTDTHALYIIPEGTPGTITVILQGSVKGDFSDAVTCGTSSTTTPNVLKCSGIYAAVRAKLTVFTGFTSVNLTYIGTSSNAKYSGGGGTVTSITASLPIVVTPDPITNTGTISCPTCATGGSIASTTNVLKGNGSGSAVASSIVDDGTNPTKTSNGVSTENNGLYNLDTNDGTTGTATNKLACIVDGTPNVRTCRTTDISGIAGSAEQGAGTTGSVELCTTICTVLFDNQTTAGDWGILSTTSAGEGHDTGLTTQTAGPQNFLILSANSGAGTTAQVKILTPDVVNPSAGSQPGKSVIEFNGTVAKSIANINSTTPAAQANNLNVTVQASNTGNTTNASMEVPYATNAAKGVVQCDGTTINCTSGVISTAGGGITSVAMPSDLFTNSPCTGPTCTFGKQSIPYTYFIKAPTSSSSLPVVVSTTTCNLSSSLNPVCNLSTPTQGGGHDTLLVHFITNSATVTSFIDSNSDVFTIDSNQTNYGRQYLFRYSNITAGVTSLTANLNVSDYTVFIVEEVQNLNVVSPIDIVSFTSAGCPSGILNFGNITTGNANDYITVATYTPNVYETLSNGTSFTILNNIHALVNGTGVDEYQNTNTSGSYPITFNNCSIGQSHQVTIAAYKAGTTPLSSQFAAYPALPGDFKSIAIGPIYDINGNLQNKLPHTLYGSCTLGTNCVITLTGNSVYSFSNSYTCNAQDTTAAAATQVVNNSNSQFTITGTGTDVINYSCVGN
jgi:hypothetical protein